MKPETEVSVTMTAREWNAVLQLVGRGAFHDVAPIIGKMEAQFRAAEEDAKE